MNRNTLGKGIAAAIAAGLLISGVYGGYEAMNPRTTKTATVTDKARVCDSGGTCKYLIYTDNGVFEDTDSWFPWKTNSSDVFGALKVGSAYEFKLKGIRSGFWSWYPNIIGYNAKN